VALRRHHLSLHYALPILHRHIDGRRQVQGLNGGGTGNGVTLGSELSQGIGGHAPGLVAKQVAIMVLELGAGDGFATDVQTGNAGDRKSTTSELQSREKLV